MMVREKLKRKDEFEMCTAVTYQGSSNYFGRNLDLEYSYNETVTITPRNYVWHFKEEGDLENHYAIIGMAFVFEDYPLYYDAMNEHGLAMAGLNFPGHANYKDFKEGCLNLGPFELIPYILSTCKDVDEVKTLFEKINIYNIAFHKTLANAPLHWIITDKNKTITVECVKEGIKIYDNKIGILTNNPTFDIHMFNLNQYMHLTNTQPEPKFFDHLDHYCQGMGGIGLPGDMSSVSRFVKAAFSKRFALKGKDENESVHQFFHILESVSFIKGCVYLGNDKYDITVYQSCMNLDQGIYYYSTYTQRNIKGVDLFKEDLNSSKLVSYPLLKQELYIQN